MSIEDEKVFTSDDMEDILNFKQKHNDTELLEEILKSNSDCKFVLETFLHICKNKTSVDFDGEQFTNDFVDAINQYYN